ncbi:MAG: Na+/H+ antiporter subunit A, partial [Clostridiales Family XIII bacterium]|nr:Na+/H+ antiporter subunit A [Clostridiales Family XIII bacterium]
MDNDDKVILKIGQKDSAHSPGWVVLGIQLVLFCLLCARIPAVCAGEAFSYRISWVSHLGIDFAFRLDGLSLFFALLITGIGLLVVWYSIFYMPPKDRLVSFYIFLFLFMLSMLGIVLSDNLILLYIFWELTSLSSFFLIGFWYERDKSRYGAQRALLVTVGGGFAMLVGFILLGQAAGTYSFSELLGHVSAVREAGTFPAIVILVLIGGFAKSAQVPFHFWLPAAMEAPTPISCYLHSATMVKAGIFLFLRLTPLFGGNMLWQRALVIFGLASLIFGSYMALRQTDLKALLAYSTISQLGLVISLIGIGTQAAIFAAVFHILNHSAFKGSLFLVTGIVDHECGTRDLRLLRGLGRLMPVTGTIAFIASLSMAGLPPFSGFLSKEGFLTAFADSASAGLPFPGPVMTALMCIAVLASLFTFVYSLTIFGKVFTGKKPAALTVHSSKPPLGLLIPTGILVCFNLLPAILPGVFGTFLISPAAS